MEEDIIVKKKKKKSFKYILIIIALVILVIGSSYAIFNYTRTGGANTVRSGRVYFTSDQNNTFTLTNVFPITRDELATDVNNHGTITIDIEGDTLYSRGIEYLISTTDVINTVNGKKVPIGIDIETSGTLGTNDDDYFDNRGGNTNVYKIIEADEAKEGKHLLVGYITSGATGIDGTITIKAFINEDKVVITDTPEANVEWQNGRVALTTTEWQSLNTSGLSFKIKVEANEGTWVDEEIHLYNIMQTNADTTTVINFSQISSSSNGEGIYRLTGTENDAYPIYYYRGNINNNNVVFGDYCWHVIRTTDTGGVKMIYNGLPDVSVVGGNITYNCGPTRSIQNDIMTTKMLNDSTGYYYADDYEIVSTSGNLTTYKLKAGPNGIHQVSIANDSDGAAKIPTIASNYPYTCLSSSSADATCMNLYKVASHNGGVVANVYSSKDNLAIGTNTFNLNNGSLSDVGYMYNTRYAPVEEASPANSIFGKNVEWNGTSYLVIDDNSGIASTNTTLDGSHHYTCGIANVTSCSSVRFYFSNNIYYDTYYGSYYYFDDGYKYITLIDGETVEDAIYKMTGNGAENVKARNSQYKLNTIDSNIKTVIETWFRTYLTSEVDNTKTNYQKYIEDTVYCNDRSFSITAFNNSGWNKEGTSISLQGELSFGSLSRTVPSVNCPNETDSFKVGNSKAHLNYPVGLLNTDEIILAGGKISYAANNLFYLFTGSDIWTMSPYSYFIAHEFYLDGTGGLMKIGTNGNKYIRPVISLKNETEIENGGDGTPANPYVVKYN